MPRAAQSSAINHWLLSEYLERPLLALTLIQRRQPSLVSSARAACSRRSRSALRRASRSVSVSGVRLKRRAIAGFPSGVGGPPRWRADPPPPARPPGRAMIGWRVGPASGRRALRPQPVVVPSEVHRAQLLARLSEQVALAEQDLVREPREGFIFGAVAPAHDRPARAARPERQLLKTQHLNDGRAVLRGAHGGERTSAADAARLPDADGSLSPWARIAS